MSDAVAALRAALSQIAEDAEGTADFRRGVQHAYGLLAKPVSLVLAELASVQLKRTAPGPNFVHTDDYDQDPARQLEDMKRLVVLLMGRLGSDEIGINYEELYDLQLTHAQIKIWPDRLTDRLMVAVRMLAPDDPVDAEALGQARLSVVREALADG